MVFKEILQKTPKINDFFLNTGSCEFESLFLKWKDLISSLNLKKGHPSTFLKGLNQIKRILKIYLAKRKDSLKLKTNHYFNHSVGDKC